MPNIFDAKNLGLSGFEKVEPVLKPDFWLDEIDENLGGLPEKA